MLRIHKHRTISFLVVFIMLNTMVVNQSAAPEQAATVGEFEQGQCGIYTPFGSVSASGHYVITNNHRGNAKLTCFGEISNPEGHAVVINEKTHPAVSCALFGAGVTDNWRTTISASGHVVLQCHFR